MIWSFTRAMGYSTTMAPGLTAAGAGRGGNCWGVGASTGLRYLGTSTWPRAQLPDIAAAASSNDATPLPLNTRRRAAFLHQLRIEFPELKIVNLKRSLSLPLPETGNLPGSRNLHPAAVPSPWTRAARRSKSNPPILAAQRRAHQFRKGCHRSEERRVGKECRSRWSPDH